MLGIWSGIKKIWLTYLSNIGESIFFLTKPIRSVVKIFYQQLLDQEA